MKLYLCNLVFMFLITQRKRGYAALHINGDASSKWEAANSDPVWNRNP